MSSVTQESRGYFLAFSHTAELHGFGNMKVAKSSHFLGTKKPASLAAFLPCVNIIFSRQCPSRQNSLISYASTETLQADNKEHFLYQLHFGETQPHFMHQGLGLAYISLHRGGTWPSKGWLITAKL